MGIVQLLDESRPELCPTAAVYVFWVSQVLCGMCCVSARVVVEDEERAETLRCR